MAFMRITAQAGMLATLWYSASASAQDTDLLDIQAHLQTVAEIAQQLGEASGNSPIDITGMIEQRLNSDAAQAAEIWLSHFGTARVDLGATHDLRDFSGAVDTLVPLYGGESHLLFTQLGLRRTDGQVTGNLGIGRRHFGEQWMLGYHLVYDQNLSRSHQRLGVGVEAWRDYMKLSGNGYLRLSGWKASPDLASYGERAANGFDIGAEGYLPAMPSLGAKLMYEQSFGNEVGMFGTDRRHANAAALTLELNYTPIPLITVGVDHRQSTGRSSTSANIQLTYQFDQPWAKQVDSRQVAARRSVAGSRRDLVERNSNIVRTYRKQQRSAVGKRSGRT